MIFNGTRHKHLSFFFAQKTAIVVIHIQKTNKKAGNIKSLYILGSEFSA
jgi:hypothetical protein